MKKASSTAPSGSSTVSTSFDCLSGPELEALMHSPATSDWLRRSYAQLLQRDALDALNDAEVLYRAMCTHFATVFNQDIQ